MATHGADERGSLPRERFEALLRSHLRWLRGWLGARLRGVDRQEVDDLCQEVLLRAVRGIGSLRHPGRFAPWLYRIASNVLRDYIRRRGCYRKRPEVRGLDLDLAPAREGSTRTESREELEAALAAVLELPARLREPLLLRHVDDLSYEEIAAILGISANAVQVRIARARERLRRSAVYRRLYAESERERGTVRAEPEPRRVAEIIDLKSVTRRRPAPANSEGHEPCTPAVPGSC